jgi:hypothetical protein
MMILVQKESNVVIEIGEQIVPAPVDGHHVVGKGIYQPASEYFVYNVDGSVESVRPQEFCYTPEAGFFKNPNYVPYVPPEERIRQLEGEIANLQSPKTPDRLYLELDKTSATLEDVKAAKIAQLNYLCNQTILAGFISAALDQEHTYGFDLEDQANLTGQLTLMQVDQSITEVDWKTKDAGVLTHTRDQFIQVCKDGAAFKNQQIAKYWTLKAQVEAATTWQEVDAITWD